MANRKMKKIVKIILISFICIIILGITFLAGRYSARYGWQPEETCGTHFLIEEELSH